MQLDGYQRCVGGADKKIKFCCGKDITQDLNAIFSAMGSEQKAAALDTANRAIQKHGEKDCLLATKASVLIQLNEYQQAESLVEKLLEHNPHNPVALGQKTTLLAVEDKVEEAVHCLQRALELYDRTISRGVLNAIRIVGALLQNHGHTTAARAHLILYNTLAEEPDSEVARLLMNTFADPSTPVFLKHDSDLPTAPGETGWATTYNSVRAHAQRGRWLSALEKLRELDRDHPNQPILRKAIAILESRIGSNESMSKAWNAYANTPGVPFEEAVEAQATAQVLVNDMLDDTVSDQKIATYPIQDAENVLGLLQSSSRAETIQRAVMPDPDQPPPKMAFVLLDREKQGELSSDIKHDEIPNVMGSIMVYGKQTDREPRVEIEGWSEMGFEDAVGLAVEILGDQLGERESENTLAQEKVMAIRMGVRWFLDKQMEPATQRRLLEAQYREFYTETWPDLPLSCFDGQTPREAAADPNNHLKLLAWLMSTEESLDTTSFEPIDLNGIREALSLPIRDSIDPSNVNLDRLPLCRFSKIDFTKLSDEQLARLIHICRIAGHGYALLKGATLQLERQPNMDPTEQYDLRMLCAYLSPNLDDGPKQFEVLDQLVDQTEIPRSSLLLTQLDWSLSRGFLDLAQEVSKKIQKRYVSEPGVAQRFAQLLVQYGVIDPKELQGRGQAGTPAPPAEASPAQNLWTPDGDTSSEDGGGSSKLWVPGMD